MLMEKRNNEFSYDMGRKVLNMSEEEELWSDYAKQSNTFKAMCRSSEAG